MNVRVINY